MTFMLTFQLREVFDEFCRWPESLIILEWFSTQRPGWGHMWQFHMNTCPHSLFYGLCGYDIELQLHKLFLNHGTRVIPLS